MKRSGCVLLALGAMMSIALGGEVGFIEDYALAKDRAAVLKQLIPGTEDYYYWHCLHYLQTEQPAKAEEMTRQWHQRFGQTGLLTEIQTRHALLTYEKNPQRSLNYLRDRLGLQFNHQREVLGQAPNLPTALDQNRISRSALEAHSLQHWSNLDNFEDSAFDWLAAGNLDWQRRRNLLQRLARPDLTNLVQLVHADLSSENNGGFGYLPIHAQMTQAQLEELAKLRGHLLGETNFVFAMLPKLRPTAEEDWRRDPKLAAAYLDRLWAFVGKLPQVFNSLKASVLYHRLALDRSQGTLDKSRFLEYLKLPRHLHYVSPRWLDNDAARGYPADLNLNYQPQTLLPPVGDDEPLVRAYLKHFLANATTAREFADYIESNYLKHVFAEAKIEAGLGEPEQWASDLPPELFRALKERVDIDFAPTNRPRFGAEEPVALDLHLKNVPTLFVKVYEINTKAWYREQKREADTDINLDGLVANDEQTYTFTEPPLRRFTKRFEFPKLTKPGVYVVDFIGGGKSSRALIRKGKLRPLASVGPAGQRILVVDDANQKVLGVKLTLGGQEYAADADGIITVPFSTQPGRQPIVLSKGDFACLDHLDHQGESYALAAGIHVEREALLSQRVAAVLIRPGLFLSGQPVSIKLLEEAKLRLTSVDQDGIASSTEVPDFKLFEDRESVHEFRVPPRLARLTVELRGKVKNLILNTKQELAAAQSFALNGIDKTDKTEDLHLAKFGADWTIELLGKTGEAKPDRPVQLALKHRDFRQPVNVTLKSDADGRVKLGALADIVSVTATGPEATSHTWLLPTDGATYRQSLHAKAGETVRVPYMGLAARPERTELALFEMRGDNIRADRFEALKIKDGMVEAAGLAPGDYDLWLKREGARVRIRIVDGAEQDGYVLGKTRLLELPGLRPVQIASLSADGDSVTIRLTDASKFARVHIFAVRYRPEYSAFHDLARVRDRELGGVYPGAFDSIYLTGRNIGDEYRYVLDRKGMRRFPGNLLERPQLLLNPWAIRSTETGEQQAQGGDEFAPKGQPPMSAPAPMTGDSFGLGRSAGAPPGAVTSNLDYLADAAAVAVNLIPDKDGAIKLNKKDLGPHAQIHVVAIDPLGAAYRSLTLPEQPAKFLDLRLMTGLDPSGHFTQQKQVSVLAAGQPFVLADVAGSRFEAYDSVAKVYGLFATLSKDPKLAEFAFVANWPSLKPEEKRKLYSQFACHELSFFLMKKDPEFFAGVIKPYLANKKDKTFLDHWLLGDDLKEWLDPWRYGRLNAVERVLLAQRLPGEAAKTARHLQDLLRLLPPNLDRQLMLFDTAVKGSELETQGKFAEVRREVEAERLQQRLKDMPALDKAASPMEAGKVLHVAPGAPSGGGGGGGPGGGLAKPGQAGGRGGAVPMREGRTKLKADEKKSADRDDASKGGKEEGLTRSEADTTLGFRFAGEDARKAYAQLYRKVDPTMEWAENNYYKLPIQQQLADLVSVSAFWLDYAKHEGQGGFLSKNFADASRGFTEMMFALAVLDLPFEAKKHDLKFEGGKMTFTPAGPAIAFHEEVKPAAAAAAKTPVLVSQNFYKHGDRYRMEDGEKVDHFVSAEFVIRTVYGCQIVVTNPTSSRQKLAVLLQLPLGAMPLAGAHPTRTIMVDLEPYRTQTIDYLFYFPGPGRFAQFPVHVAKNEQFIAAAAPFTFDVVQKPTKLDTGSWDYVSQNGSDEEVLAFLGRENASSLNLDKIAFRMGNRAFFEAATKLLRERHVYQATLWSYSLFHNSLPELREYLRHLDNLAAECGNGPLESAPLVIDAVARHLYEHLEYKPLVNARAHALGKRRQIVNDRLHTQYHAFLKQLSYKKSLDDADRLALAYYLLLQDRIEEALAAFAAVNPANVASALQYDYCAAYLAFFSDEPQRARAIALKHANHPVDRWRNAFAAISSQLDEIEGKKGAVADAESRAERQGQLAAGEPSFAFTLDAKKINLTWQNLEAVRVNYYLMDVELLFSRNPFVQQHGGQFSAIRPNRTQDLKLPAGQAKLSIPLPEDLARKNVLVEVTAAGKQSSAPYYANALDVTLQENYGQITVADAATAKGLAKVYVKVYVRLADGQVKFHKDGYTDHRGKFDYASVSTPERTPIARFAILVLSEDKGAQIKEANPPAQ